jgi:hypothetical protein
MKKVGSESIPFGNSTPTEIIVQRIQEARASQDQHEHISSKRKHA